MCKHVAAVLYGIGARLDDCPELFFQLRGVDHAELITAAGTAEAVTRTAKSSKILKSQDLSGIFGIELDASTASDDKASKAAPSKKRVSLVRKPTERKKKKKKKK